MSLSQACRDGDVEAVKALLAQGAAVNAPSPIFELTPLVEAAMHDQVQVARILIAAGAHVDPPDDVYAPLHAAAAQGNVEMCELLLEYGAAVDGSVHIMTPLGYAARHGKTEVVRLLLARGAMVEGHPSAMSRSRPLHHAVQPPNNVEVVKALLEAGADANALDSNANSPLYLAAQASHYDNDYYNDDLQLRPTDQGAKAARLEVFKMLLAAGAKLEMCGCIGEYALQLEARVAQLEDELKMWRAMPPALTEAIVGVANHVQSPSPPAPTPRHMIYLVTADCDQHGGYPDRKVHAMFLDKDRAIKWAWMHALDLASDNRGFSMEGWDVEANRRTVLCDLNVGRLRNTYIDSIVQRARQELAGNQALPGLLQEFTRCEQVL